MTLGYYAIVLTFVVSSLSALLFTPLAMRLAALVGAIDHPGERKVHTSPIPRFGGVAVVPAIVVAMATGLLFTGETPGLASGPGSSHFLLLFSLLIILGLGVWDDISPLKAIPKLGVQILAATLAYFAGFQLPVGTFLFHGVPHNGLWIVDLCGTILWVAGVTNATNLIDGLDGLAAGVAAIAAFTIAAIALAAGELGIALAAAAIAGSTLGFLRYNFHRAKIFLGDSGSLFLGFTLALLAVVSVTTIQTPYPLFVPVLVLGIPIADTTLSMVRRLLRDLMTVGRPEPIGVGILKKMFVPDKNHIHHRLLMLGFSHREVVFVLYLVSAGLGILAYVLSRANGQTATLLLLATAMGIFPLVHKLQYSEILLHRNGVLLRLVKWLYSWPLLQRRAFQVFIDSAFVVSSFFVAHLLAGGHHEVDWISSELLILAAVGVVTHLVVFYETGLYSRLTRRLGVGDAISIGRSVLFAVAMFYGLSWILFPLTSDAYTVPVILQGYFLLTLIMGSRFAYTLLSFYLTRERNGKTPVLIYGANTAGLLLHELAREHEALNMFPVGFIDDDPSLEGKSLNGSPVFGTHWTIKSVLTRMEVREILLSTDQIPSENLLRLEKVCHQNGVVLTRLRLTPEQTTFARNHDGSASTLHTSSISSKSPPIERR